MFVCLGNICRSPLAHGVMEDLLIKRKMETKILVDSSGTGAWHVGNFPDSRVRATASKNNISLNHRAQQFKKEDFELFDLIFAMDDSVYQDIIHLAKDDFEGQKVKYFRKFDPLASDHELDVPDPYYGGDAGFVRVFDIVMRGCEEIIKIL